MTEQEMHAKIGALKEKIKSDYEECQAKYEMNQDDLPPELRTVIREGIAAGIEELKNRPGNALYDALPPDPKDPELLQNKIDLLQIENVRLVDDANRDRKIIIILTIGLIISCLIASIIAFI